MLHSRACRLQRLPRRLSPIPPCPPCSPLQRIEDPIGLLPPKLILGINKRGVHFFRPVRFLLLPPFLCWLRVVLLLLPIRCLAHVASRL